MRRRLAEGGTTMRWICERCDSAANAPARPRRDDVRRYCLACSKETGKLVQRRCPKLDDRRAARAQRDKERARAKATKQRERRVFCGVNVDHFALQVRRAF